MTQEDKEAQYREEARVELREMDYSSTEESAYFYGFVAGRKKGEEELLAATRKIMNAKECTCEAMPSINECPFHLHKEISKQDDQIESLKKELEALKGGVLGNGKS